MEDIAAVLAAVYYYLLSRGRRVERRKRKIPVWSIAARLDAARYDRPAYSRRPAALSQ